MSGPLIEDYATGPVEQIALLREAIRLTREYIGEPTLPAVEGFSWFDAIKATGGFAGFGGCGVSLDPHKWGRTNGGNLLSCNLPPDHDGDHGRAAHSTEGGDP